MSDVDCFAFLSLLEIEQILSTVDDITFSKLQDIAILPYLPSTPHYILPLQYTNTCIVGNWFVIRQLGKRSSNYELANLSMHAYDAKHSDHQIKQRSI